MALETERRKNGDLIEIYSWDPDEKGSRKRVFIIDGKRSRVRFFPRDVDSPVKEIVFEGFNKIPPELNEAGYIKTTGVQYYFKAKLREKSITALTISSESGKGILKKAKNSVSALMSYENFKELIQGFKRVAADAQNGRRRVSASVFHTAFPKDYALPEEAARTALANLLGALDKIVIPQMSNKDVERFTSFYEAVLKDKYPGRVQKRRLVRATKMKVDTVALTDIISEFESLLTKHHSEFEWSKFLRKNLYFVESRYIDLIEELNVVMAGSRKVDFAMIDNERYLDLFEIKRPETKLLASKQDRGNYVWHTDAMKAIVQAEKYLQNATQNSLALQAGVKREKGRDVLIVRPRVVLIIGSRAQLDTPAKKEDFRVLRMSFKNIEIRLYDELLEQLKNQLKKTVI